MDEENYIDEQDELDLIDFCHSPIVQASSQFQRDPGIVSILFILFIDVKTKLGTREGFISCQGLSEVPLTAHDEPVEP